MMRKKMESKMVSKCDASCAVDVNLNLCYYPKCIHHTDDDMPINFGLSIFVF